MNPDSLSHKEALILAAARKRFAYYGFSKATMDEIAADVNLAKPSLYYYYPTKENLFRAVIAREQEQFLRDAESILRKNIPSAEKLREYAATRFRLFQEFVNLSAPGAQSWAEVKSISRDLLQSLEAEELRLVQRLLDAGEASGEFTIPDKNKTALLFLHVLQGLRMRTFRIGHAVAFDEAAQKQLRGEMDFFTEIMLAAIGRITQLKEPSWSPTTTGRP